MEYMRAVFTGLALGTLVCVLAILTNVGI